MIHRITILAVVSLSILVPAACAEPILHWSPSDTLVALGDQATLSVVLDEALDVRTVEIYVEFDPAIVATVDGGPGALFDGFNLFSGFEEDAPNVWHGYCVILGASEWTTGPGEIWRWTVEGTAIGVSPITTVEFTLLPPGGGDYPDAELLDDQVRVDDLSGVAPQLPAALELSLFPNPFNPRTRIELMLPEGGAGRLEVLDLRGRLLATPWSGVAGATPVVVPWDGRDEAGLALPSGVYMFRLAGPHGQATHARGVLIR